MDSAIKTILDHETFRDIAKESPAGFGKKTAPDAKKQKQTPQTTTSMSPFDLDHLHEAMAGPGRYTCAGNDWWLNPTFSPQPGIPYNTVAIDGLNTSTFNEPEDYIGTTVILVPEKKFNPLNHKGGLMRLSPEEMFYAKILRVADIIKTEPANTELLNRWRAAFLNSSFTFELFESGGVEVPEAALARSMNLREQAVGECAAVGRTALQRIFEVNKTRKMLEDKMGAAKVTVGTVAQYYKDNVKLAAKSERVTDTFVGQANMIWPMLKCREIVETLQDMENHWGSAGPMDSHTKLQIIITKCEKSTPHVLFVLRVGWPKTNSLNRRLPAPSIKK